MELVLTKSGVEIRAALAQRLPVVQATLRDAASTLEGAVAAAQADGYTVDRAVWSIRDPSSSRSASLTQAHAVAIAHAREAVERAEFDAGHVERLLRNVTGLNVERDYMVSEADLLRLGF